MQMYGPREGRKRKNHINSLQKQCMEHKNSSTVIERYVPDYIDVSICVLRVNNVAKIALIYISVNRSNLRQIEKPVEEV